MIVLKRSEKSRQQTSSGELPGATGWVPPSPPPWTNKNNVRAIYLGAGTFRENIFYFIVIYICVTIQLCQSIFDFGLRIYLFPQFLRHFNLQFFQHLNRDIIPFLRTSFMISKANIFFSRVIYQREELHLLIYLQPHPISYSFWNTNTT